MLAQVFAITSISFLGNKYFRNLCELAYNGAVWGRVGEAVVEVIF